MLNTYTQRNKGPDWITLQPALPKMWRTILSSGSHHLAGVEIERGDPKKLAWYRFSGAYPKKTLGSSQQPKIWLGDLGLESKQPQNLGTW
jgi:hypothetical protein